MTEPSCIDVYSLTPVENVCNEILREVITLKGVSMAHVTMEGGDVSLWHRHSRMAEVYYILGGEGILYTSDTALYAEAGAYQVISSSVPHMLHNTGSSELEHLVFAVPPFDPDDVEVLEDYNGEGAVPQAFWYDSPPVEAADGAMVYELISDEERGRLDMALALGSLPPRRKADPHYHMRSEELYYVTDGVGKVTVGDTEFDVGKGSLVYVPPGYLHALENTDTMRNLEVLCVSSPAYSSGDFYTG